MKEGRSCVVVGDKLREVVTSEGVISARSSRWRLGARNRRAGNVAQQPRL